VVEAERRQAWHPTKSTLRRKTEDYFLGFNKDKKLDPF